MKDATRTKLRRVNTATLASALHKRGLFKQMIQDVRPSACRRAAPWSVRPTRCATCRRART